MHKSAPLFPSLRRTRALRERREKRGERWALDFQEEGNYDEKREICILRGEIPVLDIKRLRYLEAVYRYKNFTRASEECFVSQPAISAAISALEKELDINLIVRDSKKVQFTFEGEQFMMRVNRILKECEEAERLAADLSATGSRTLRLGMSPTLSLRLLPHLYSEFFPRWPSAKLHLDESSMNNHIEKIRSDLLDLSYNALPPEPERSTLKIIPVTMAEVCVILNPKHPLARLERIPIESLEGQNVCLLDKFACIHDLMMDAFEKKDVIPNTISYHEQILCMYHMVEFGNAIGFSNVTEGSTTFAFGGTELAVRPFEEPILFEAGFIMKPGKQLPRIARELIRFTTETRDAWDRPVAGSGKGQKNI